MAGAGVRLRLAAAALALAAPAFAQLAPTERFLALSASAAEGRADARLDAAVLLADCARYEEALRWLDAEPLADADARALRRWLVALCGEASPGAAASPAARPEARAIPPGEPTRTALRRRLSWEVPALEALAERHGAGSGGLLALGTPEVVPARDAEGVALVRLWRNDGTCATHLWRAGRLEDTRGGTLEVRAAPAAGGGMRAQLDGSADRAWTVLQLAESVPLSTSVSGEAVWLDAPGLLAVRPARGALSITARPARDGRCGELVTGLLPVPAAPGLALDINGQLPTPPGALALGRLPCRAEATDPPLFGWAAGVSALTSGTPAVLGCADRPFANGRNAAEVSSLARDLLAAARRLGAPGAGRAVTFVLLAGGAGDEVGFTRGTELLIGLALPEQPEHLAPLVAHEIGHATLEGGRRGWPGDDPEEGLANYLAVALSRAAGHDAAARTAATDLRDRATRLDPLQRLPLARALALDRLPRPFATYRPGSDVGGAQLATRLLAVDARLTAEGTPSDALARAIFAVAGASRAPLPAADLPALLARALGRPVPELAAP